MTRAATYGRQSKAREDESAASPHAQRQAGEAFIKARSWEHAGHFEDVGISGFDPKARRPDLERLLKAVRRRELDAVVVYKLDRFTRQGVVEAVRLVGVLEEHGVAFVSVMEPFLDTSTPMGRGIFALFAAMAEQESANIRTRVRSAKALLRAAGSFAGGQRRYGFESVKEMRDGLAITVLKLHPEEAPVLRDVITRVIEGASVSSEARRLNREGIPTTTGAEWSTSTLIRVLRSPTLVGWAATERDGIVRDAAGAPLEAWEGILDPSTYWRLQEALSGRQGGRRLDDVPTLLGGSELLLCAGCGGRMAGDRRRDGRGTYRCARARRGSARCEGGAVAMAHADEHVARSVWDRLLSADLDDADDLELLRAVAERFNAREVDPELEAARATIESTLRDAEAALSQLDDDRAAGAFPGEAGRGRYLRQVQALTERQEAAQARLQALPAPGPADELGPLLELLGDLEAGADPLGPEGAWQAWDVRERRAFLGLALDAVLVSKGAGRGGGTVRWRGAERMRLVWVAPRPPFV